MDAFFDEIDAARSRRARELTDVKSSYGLLEPYGSEIASKTVVVLAYANWEGFYNECVKVYFRFLSETGAKVKENDWNLLVGALGTDLDSMRDRNHSLQSRSEFIDSLRLKLECNYSEVNFSVVMARSNLDFKRLQENYEILNFPIEPFLETKNRLNKELVGWRHAVAHGDSPDLTAMDVEDHISFASNMLLTVADQFQQAILDRG